jgi:glucose dehydrogenase
MSPQLGTNNGRNDRNGEATMSTRRYWNSTALGLVSLLLAGAAALAQQPQAADPTKNLTPVTDAMLRDPPPSDWLMWRRTYNGYGYSPLDQVNKSNV